MNERIVKRLIARSISTNPRSSFAPQPVIPRRSPPSMAGLIGKAAKGAAIGATVGGAAKLAQRIMPRTVKAFDTRMKDGAALKPVIKKKLGGFYK